MNFKIKQGQLKNLNSQPIENGTIYYAEDKSLFYVDSLDERKGINSNGILMPDNTIFTGNDIENLKNSVSEGKQLISSAITDRGIAPAGENFLDLAEAIKKIPGVKTGTFTPTSTTDCIIEHNLGSIPQAFAIICLSNNIINNKMQVIMSFGINGKGGGCIYTTSYSQYSAYYCYYKYFSSSSYLLTSNPIIYYYNNNINIFNANEDTVTLKYNSSPLLNTELEYTWLCY